MDLSGQDLDNVTRTIIAEAGQNGTPASMAAVASVIRNRMAAGGYGKTPSEIVHAPNQFEPWNPGSGNDPMRFQADSPAYKQAAALAQGDTKVILTSRVDVGNQSRDRRCSRSGKRAYRLSITARNAA